MTVCRRSQVRSSQTVRQAVGGRYRKPMPIVLDDSAWPILHHSVGEHTRHQFDAFGDWYFACLKRARADNVCLSS